MRSRVASLKSTRRRVGQAASSIASFIVFFIVSFYSICVYMCLCSVFLCVFLLSLMDPCGLISNKMMIMQNTHNHQCVMLFCSDGI